LTLVQLSREERAKRIVERMEKRRGYAIGAGREFLAEIDPDFAEAYELLYEDVLCKDGPLPVKYKELIAMVLLAARRVDPDGHIKRALKHGATKEEIVDAFKVAMIPAGVPTMSFGLSRLKKVLDELEGEGK